MDSHVRAACNVFSANVNKRGLAQRRANRTVLTWGRRDDGSLFVDSDLSFVLFRLPIVRPVFWWGIGRRGGIVNLSEASGKTNFEDGRQSGVSGHANRNKMAYFIVATACSAPLTRPTPPKWLPPFVRPSKEYSISLYHAHTVFADNKSTRRTRPSYALCFQPASYQLHRGSLHSRSVSQSSSLLPRSRCACVLQTQLCDALTPTPCL